MITMKIVLFLLACLNLTIQQTFPQCPNVTAPAIYFAEQLCQYCEFTLRGCVKCEPQYTLAPMCLLCNEQHGFQPTPYFRESDGAMACRCKDPNADVDYTGTDFSCYTCNQYQRGCVQCTFLPKHPQIQPFQCLQCLDYLGEFKFIAEDDFSQCVCTDPSKYIEPGQRQDQCISCNIPMLGCLTCNSSTYCFTCNTSYHFQPNANGQGKCVCTPPYSLAPNGEGCGLFCPEGCLSCPDPLICGACDIANHFELNQTSQLCVCQSGYYLQNSVCHRCSNAISGCTICSSSTICTRCDANQNFAPVTAANICECRDTFYPALLLSVEFPNLFDCQPCASTSLHCVACKSPTNCTRCESGYGVDATFKCSSCNTVIAGCQTCTSLNNCTKCDLAAHFALDSGNCICSNPYYFNATLGQCTQCMTGCVSCSNSTRCITCASTHALNNGVCDLCNVAIPGCTKCTSTSFCTECDLANQFTLINNVCYCPDQQYLDPAARICKRCNESGLENCVNCLNATYCSNCALGGYIFYKPSSAEQVCRHCNVTLTGCLQCSSSTSCTLCDTSRNYAPDGSGICKCAPGYFMNGAGTCSLCSSFMPGCQRCTSNQVCTQCDLNKNFILNPTIPKCDCKRNYFLNATGSCVKIDSIMGCADYIDANTCANCDTNFRTYKDKCECYDGFYLERSNNTCQPCSASNCSICTGENQCHKCAEFYRLENNECIACPFLCKTCNVTHCLTCLDYANNLYTPECVCNTNTYLDVERRNCTLCRDVLFSCFRCTSRTNCTHCEGNKAVLGGQCAKCRVGYYINQTKNTCQECDKNCRTCSKNPRNCTSCPGTQFHKLKNGECLCDGLRTDISEYNETEPYMLCFGVSIPCTGWQFRIYYLCIP